MTTTQEQLATLATELGISLPPTDLWSDEPPLESDFHREQIDLLIRLLKRYWATRNDYYVTGNLTIYYSEDQITTRDFRGPDFFVVLGTEFKQRKSWVVWTEEGKYPNLIVEILSKSTAMVDQGPKKDLYQNTFRTPEYFWLDPDTLELAGFRLMGKAYQPTAPAIDGKLWSEQLELYLGVADRYLRFFTPEGEQILTAEEAEIQERQRADRLAAKLRELGFDPNQI
ncbi:Uma2 family endonuclease [Leptodesmis sp.]|uniref:Uma2 family endonuclease n=1 Tax=Leptodesmis sp. TaxID=3100501 RepID=UPI004053563D